MTARMTTHPALLIPDAFDALQALAASAAKGDVPQRIVDLVLMRVSQINGCGACLDMHSRAATRAGESDRRLHTVAAWRETVLFSEAECAALALAESVTRLSDRPDPVPDEVWDEAARHFDEVALASLLLTIASINVWNRLNVATHQEAGAVPLS